MSLVEWLENQMFTCPYKSYFGFDCLACGIQRAMMALLRGDLRTSLYLYPALIPLIFMVLFIGSHLYFKFKHGARLINYLFIFNAGLILTTYIIKHL